MEMRIGEVLTVVEGTADALMASVAAIEARGGRVVSVRLTAPSQDESVPTPLIEHTAGEPMAPDRSVGASPR